MTSFQGASVQGVVEWARRRVLAHKILSGPALMQYFISRVALDPTLDMDRLQEEAVARGIYRYLGERYLLALDFTVACAGAAIKLDVIRSEEDLARFLERASHSLAPFGNCGKAHNDLRIDARQKGLYSLIESKAAAPV